MNKNLSYFVYRPPKSNSFGHAVRDKNISRALKKMIDALTDILNAKPIDELTVIIYYKKVDELEFQSAIKVIDQLSKLLGEPQRRWDNTGFEQHDNYVTWVNKDKNIFEVLELIQMMVKSYTLPLNKYWLGRSYHYGTRDQPNGHITCSIELGRLFVRFAYLVLPINIEDQRIWSLISELKERLPFKLNGNHFRRLGTNKNRYGKWKLDAETQLRLNNLLG